MKKTKVSLAVAAATLISAPAFATNGDLLIGLGAQSRALGGTGTAANYGSENALTNPSMLGKNQGTEFAIAGTLFMPDVKVESDVMAPGTTAGATSEADLNIIPEVSMYHRLNDHWTFGLGMYGTAGMGVDYRDEDALFNATSNLQLMKFVPSLAYNNERFGIGFAPVIQYGALDLNYVSGGNTVGSGVADDIGFGYNLGGHYDINPALTVGVAYQAAIEMDYEDQITDAADGFGIGPNGNQAIASDKLEQPAEVKIGVAYNVNNKWMVTADAKQVQWGSAEGYKDFNWDDQAVYGLGAKYTGSGYWVGFGYNYCEDPIDVLPEQSTGATPAAGGMTGYTNQAINLFNNHFFPAVTESHFTFGGGYSLNKTMTIEGAVTYAPEVDKEIKTGVISSALGSNFASTADAGTTHEVNHSQTGITLSLRMNF